MFTRLTTFTGATDIDAGIAFVRDTVLPALHEQQGFKGLTASADRAGGVLAALSIWESAAARDASDSAITKVRDEAQRVIGGTATVENFEQVHAEMAAPPVEGSALLVRRITMEPERIDDNIEYFVRDVVPQLKAGPGFLGVRALIDRESGKGLIGSAWRDEAAMKTSMAGADSRQADAVARGVSLSEFSEREIVVLDLG